jgi:hypothetical protein
MAKRPRIQAGEPMTLGNNGKKVIAAANEDAHTVPA